MDHHADGVVPSSRRCEEIGPRVISGAQGQVLQPKHQGQEAPPWACENLTNICGGR